MVTKNEPEFIDLERLVILLPRGAKDHLKALAKEHQKSVSEYLRDILEAQSLYEHPLKPVHPAHRPALIRAEQISEALD